jgi:hypothetical protein
MCRHTAASSLIVAMNLLAFSAIDAAETANHQLPTATEVFQLRSLCAGLVDKLLDETTVGSALTKDQSSHYEPRSNRCYVELTIQTADATRPNPYINRVLYDGQTKEMLAYARIERGKKVGMIFDKQHRMADPTKNLGWDDASAYIDEKMLDDRN